MLSQCVVADMGEGGRLGGGLGVGVGLGGGSWQTVPVRDFVSAALWGRDVRDDPLALTDSRRCHGAARSLTYYDTAVSARCLQGAVFSRKNAGQYWVDFQNLFLLKKSEKENCGKLCSQSDLLLSQLSRSNYCS